MTKEQGWKNAREQGAEGKNVKGAGSNDPRNRASIIIGLNNYLLVWEDTLSI